MTAHKKATSAAPVTAPAVAEVPTEAVATIPAAAEDAAAVQTVAIADPEPADAKPPAELVENTELPTAPTESVFPVEITLSNNGGFAITEPVSGAFLSAGGTQTVWLHDAAHASRVLDNLRELAQCHHLTGLLLVNGLPLDTD